MTIERKKICNGMSQVSKFRDQYVMHRFFTAIDRVIASQSKEQRIKAVTWAKLWHEQVKSSSLQYQHEPPTEPMADMVAAMAEKSIRVNELPQSSVELAKTEHADRTGPNRNLAVGQVGQGVAEQSA